MRGGSDYDDSDEDEERMRTVMQTTWTTAIDDNRTLRGPALACCGEPPHNRRSGSHSQR